MATGPYLNGNVYLIALPPTKQAVFDDGDAAPASRDEAAAARR